jgi:hypothetical protein
METHTHADGTVGERSLSVGGGEYSIFRSRENDEKRVALSVHLGATVIGERPPQQSTVSCQSLRVVVSELLQQAGRALDVCEQEGDGSGGEMPHAQNDGTLRGARLVHWRIPWRAAGREGTSPCKRLCARSFLNRVRMFDSCRGHSL